MSDHGDGEGGGDSEGDDEGAAAARALAWEQLPQLKGKEKLMKEVEQSRALLTWKMNGWSCCQDAHCTGLV